MKKLLNIALASILTIAFVGGSSNMADAVALKTMATGNVTLMGSSLPNQAIEASTTGWAVGVTLHYQWFRNNSLILDANQYEFLIPDTWTNADSLKVRLTATKPGYKTIVKYSSSLTVNAFNLIKGPTITGMARSGQTLTATCGTWVPVPESCDFEWHIGDTVVQNSTDANLTLLGDWAGLRAVVVVTPHFEALPTTTRSSGATSVIVGIFSVESEPQVSGENVVGQTLSVTPPVLTPTASRITYQWYRGGSKISGATRSSYALSSGDYHKAIYVTITSSLAHFQNYSIKVNAASNTYKVLTATGSWYTGYSTFSYCDHIGYYSCSSWFWPNSSSVRLYTNGGSGEFVWGNFDLPFPVNYTRVTAWRAQCNVVLGSGIYAALMVPASGPGFLSGDSGNSTGITNDGIASTNWTSNGISGPNAYWGFYESTWGSVQVGNCRLQVHYKG